MSGMVPETVEAVVAYRKAVMRVRGWCATLAFFGGIAIWQGIELMTAGFNLAAGGIVVGVVLLLVAAVAALKPSPRTMLLEAVAFAMIAAWDLFLALLSGGEAVELAIWGVIEAGIAIHLFVKLPAFRVLDRQRPPREAIEQLDTIVKGIRKANAKTDASLIEFVAGTTPWRARLADGIATFVQVNQGHDVILAPAETVTVVDHTPAGKDPRARSITITAGERTWKTKLRREHAQRLLAWNGLA